MVGGGGISEGTAYLTAFFLAAALVQAGPTHRSEWKRSVKGATNSSQNSPDYGECITEQGVYHGGESVPSPGPCETCTCRPPKVFCSMMPCPINPGCRTIQRSNQCCPDYRCECEHNGTVYNNGERIEIPEQQCQVCYCKGGEVMCTSITCYHRDDCEPNYEPGKCCPKYDHCPPLDASNGNQKEKLGNSIKISRSSNTGFKKEMQPWLLTQQPVPKEPETISSTMSNYQTEQTHVMTSQHDPLTTRKKYQDHTNVQIINELTTDNDIKNSITFTKTSPRLTTLKQDSKSTQDEKHLTSILPDEKHILTTTPGKLKITNQMKTTTTDFMESTSTISPEITTNIDEQTEDNNEPTLMDFPASDMLDDVSTLYNIVAQDNPNLLSTIRLPDLSKKDDIEEISQKMTTFSVNSKNFDKSDNDDDAHKKQTSVNIHNYINNHTTETPTTITNQEYFENEIFTEDSIDSNKEIEKLAVTETTVVPQNEEETRFVTNSNEELTITTMIPKNYEIEEDTSEDNMKENIPFTTDNIIYEYTTPPAESFTILYVNNHKNSNEHRNNKDSIIDPLLKPNNKQEEIAKSHSNSQSTTSELINNDEPQKTMIPPDPIILKIIESSTENYMDDQAKQIYPSNKKAVESNEKDVTETKYGTIASILIPSKDVESLKSDSLVKENDKGSYYQEKLHHKKEKDSNSEIPMLLQVQKSKKKEEKETDESSSKESLNSETSEKESSDESAEKVKNSAGSDKKCDTKTKSDQSKDSAKEETKVKKQTSGSSSNDLKSRETSIKGHKDKPIIGKHKSSEENEDDDNEDEKDDNDDNNNNTDDETSNEKGKDKSDKNITDKDDDSSSESSSSESNKKDDDDNDDEDTVTEHNKKLDNKNKSKKKNQTNPDSTSDKSIGKAANDDDHDQSRDSSSGSRDENADKKSDSDSSSSSESSSESRSQTKEKSESSSSSSESEKSDSSSSSSSSSVSSNLKSKNKHKSGSDSDESSSSSSDSSESNSEKNKSDSSSSSSSSEPNDSKSDDKKKSESSSGSSSNSESAESKKPHSSSSSSESSESKSDSNDSSSSSESDSSEKKSDSSSSSSSSSSDESKKSDSSDSSSSSESDNSRKKSDSSSSSSSSSSDESKKSDSSDSSSSSESDNSRKKSDSSSSSSSSSSDESKKSDSSDSSSSSESDNSRKKSDSSSSSSSSSSDESKKSDSSDSSSSSESDNSKKRSDSSSSSSSSDSSTSERKADSDDSSSSSSSSSDSESRTKSDSSESSSSSDDSSESDNTDEVINRKKDADYRKKSDMSGGGKDKQIFNKASTNKHELDPNANVMSASGNNLETRSQIKDTSNVIDTKVIGNEGKTVPPPVLNITDDLPFLKIRSQNSDPSNNEAGTIQLDLFNIKDDEENEGSEKSINREGSLKLNSKPAIKVTVQNKNNLNFSNAHHILLTPADLKMLAEYLINEKIRPIARPTPRSNETQIPNESLKKNLTSSRVKINSILSAGNINIGVLKVDNKKKTNAVDISAESYSTESTNNVEDSNGVTTDSIFGTTIADVETFEPIKVNKEETKHKIDKLTGDESKVTVNVVKPSMKQHNKFSDCDDEVQTEAFTTEMNGHYQTDDLAYDTTTHNLASEEDPCVEEEDELTTLTVDHENIEFTTDNLLTTLSEKDLITIITELTTPTTITNEIETKTDSDTTEIPKTTNKAVSDDCLTNNNINKDNETDKKTVAQHNFTTVSSVDQTVKGKDLQVKSTSMRKSDDRSDNNSKREITRDADEYTSRKVKIPNMESIVKESFSTTLDDKDLIILQEFLKKHMIIN